MCFEVLLVNDGSTDSSLAICQQLEEKHPNIKVFTQENKGLSATRNRGLEEATGKYIYFIDSDDYLQSNYLNRFLSIALESDLCWLAFDKFKTFDRYTATNDIHELQFAHEGDGIKIMADYNVDNAAWIYLVKRETINNARFIEGRLCEDGIFTFEVLQNVKKGRVYKNQIYGYYFNPDSIVRTKNTARLHLLKNDLFFVSVELDKVIETLPQTHPDYEKAFHRIRDRQEAYLFFGIIRFLRLKESNTALKKHLHDISQSKYPIYPIKVFKGYNSRLNKVMIQLVNRRPILFMINSLNKVFKVMN